MLDFKIINPLSLDFSNANSAQSLAELKFTSSRSSITEEESDGPRIGISKQQRKAIRTYVKQGHSSNKIQEKLSARGLGLGRKTLLSEVRKIKGKKKIILKYKPKGRRKP